MGLGAEIVADDPLFDDSQESHEARLREGERMMRDAHVPEAIEAGKSLNRRSPASEWFMVAGVLVTAGADVAVQRLNPEAGPIASAVESVVSSAENSVLSRAQRLLKDKVASLVPSVGKKNNIKGAVFENVLDSAARRLRQFPFFRSRRRGGMDLGVLTDGTVVLREAKFANNLQFSDFTAITENLKANIEEIRAALAKTAGLTKEEKAMIRRTLDEALAGRAPTNLKIEVVTGKSAVGRRLQKRLRESVGGIPVEFKEFP